MKQQTLDSIKIRSKSLLRVPMPTTKTPLLQLAMATTAPQNLAAQSTLQLPPVATWVTNTSPSARAKAMTRKHAPMRAMCRRRTIAKTRLRMGVIWHAFSSMRMFFLKMVFHKVFIARCIMRHGMRLTGRIMDSIRGRISILFLSLTATRLLMYHIHQRHRTYRPHLRLLRHHHLQ